MKKLLSLLLLLSLITNNVVYSMEPIIPQKESEAEYVELPRKLIEIIAAGYNRKNVLMRVNKAWNTYCSKKNAANIISINTTLSLGHLDAKHLLNCYAYEGNESAVINLLRNCPGIDINSEDDVGMTALTCACDNFNNAKMISLLRKHGAKTITKYHTGSPLFQAVYYGKVDMVKFLVLAYLEQINQSMRPLIVASYLGYDEIVQILLEEKADINATCGGDNTSLHLACRNGRLSIVSLLLSQKANIKAINNRKETPLHEACFNGYLDIVQLLIEYGVDETVQNKNSKTAVQLAQERGHHDIVQFFADHGLLEPRTEIKKIEPAKPNGLFSQVGSFLGW